MRFNLNIHPKALKDIRKLSALDIKRVEAKIDKLALNPRPQGYKKLINYESDRMPSMDCYRIRIGDIRVIYSIVEEIITITVIQVQKRGDIY
jgi:mRNA interferase RelE/StbE